VKLSGLIVVPAEGAFFYDDQAAIRGGATIDGAWYRGEPITSGFTAPRMPARAMSIGLGLEGSLMAWGDAMSVQYAGVGGRERVFNPVEAIEPLLDEIGPRLHGRSANCFRTNAEWLHQFKTSDGERIPVALRYGLSQALLQAAAAVRQCSMAEVVQQDFDLLPVAKAVPVYAQTGDDRYVNVDKMIMKRVDVLPHGLINSPAKFGYRGSTFLEYVSWVVRRIKQLAKQDDYFPRLHFDVYGMVGLEFGLNSDAVADFLGAAEKRAGCLPLCIESPVDFGSETAQVDGYAELRARLRAVGSSVRIAVDEWCNTLDDIATFASAGAADIIQIKMPDLGGLDRSVVAVELCKAHGVGAFLGGSCVETDLSARASVHIAVATQADMQLAKPGMGVDEGLSIVRNEQSRLLALLGRNGYCATML